MKNNKILAAVLAGVLASCSDTKTEPTGAASATTSKTVSGLRVVKTEGATTWSALTSKADTKIATPTFTVETKDAKASFLSNYNAFVRAKNTVADGKMDAAVTVLAVGGETLTVAATDTTGEVKLYGLGLSDLKTTNPAATTNVAGIFDVTTTSGKTFAVGSVLGDSKDETFPNEIRVHGDGTFALDSAILTNTKIMLDGAAKLAFASYETAVDGAGVFLIQSVALGKNATIISATAITIPAGHTLALGDTTAAITFNGATDAAKALTNLGTLEQVSGTITATTFTNGKAAVTGATSSDAVAGTHTMTGGLVTGAYTNLAGEVSLNTGAKIDGAFENKAGATLTIAGDAVAYKAPVVAAPGITASAEVKAVAASTITGAVTNEGILTMTGGVLAGDVTNSAKGKVEISGGELQKTFTSGGTDKDNHAKVAMSGGKITGITKNNAWSDFTMTGGELAAVLTNAANATFTISGASADAAAVGTTAAVKATKVHSVRNTGTFIVKGGATGAFQNDENGVFTFDSTDNATVGAVTVDAAKANTFNFTTGKTLTTGTVALNAATVINLTLGAGAGTAAAAPTVSLISATGAVNLATAKITVKASQDIAAGSVFKLVTTDTAMVDGNKPTINPTVDATMTKDGTAAYDLTKLALDVAADKKSLTLTVTEAIKYKAPAAVVSNIIAGGFGQRSAAKAQRVAGTPFAFANNGKIVNGKFDGRVAFQNASTFAGLDLTHSVAATSKTLTESSFNDASFTASVSKDLGSNGFTFAPSIALGVVQAFGVNASAVIDGSTFSVRDASNTSLLAEVGFASSTSFKFNGVEFGASASASVASKSGDQRFNMTNAFGDVAVGQAAKSNVALSFGVTAKIDAKTSFYATAKSESYNNSKAFQVGVKF